MACVGISPSLFLKLLFCISQRAVPLCAETLLAVLSTQDSEEALLYCVGALKFLSGNAAILRLLLDNNCMSATQMLIGRLCGAEAARSAMAGHILVQVRPWGVAWTKLEQLVSNLFFLGAPPTCVSDQTTISPARTH